MNEQKQRMDRTQWKQEPGSHSEQSDVRLLGKNTGSGGRPTGVVTISSYRVVGKQAFLIL